MPSEALRNIRTMRQLKTNLDLVRSQKLRTTNSLSKTDEEVAHLLSLSDPKVEQILEKERRRFAAQEVAIDASRRRLIKAREKLATTVNKNRALTELRRELQQARREGNDPVPTKAKMSTPEPNLHRIELKY